MVNKTGMNSVRWSIIRPAFVVFVLFLLLLIVLIFGFSAIRSGNITQIILASIIFPLGLIFLFWLVILITFSIKLLFKVLLFNYKILVSEDFKIIMDSDGGYFNQEDHPPMSFLGKPPYDIIKFHEYVLHLENSDTKLIKIRANKTAPLLMLDWIFSGTRKSFFCPLLFMRQRQKFASGLRSAQRNRLSRRSIDKFSER